MKKFTLILLILPLILATFNSIATKKVSVLLIESPIVGYSIQSWVPVRYEVVIKNIGSEAILATDTLNFMFAKYVNPSFIPYKVFDIYRALAPNDTFHFSFTYTLHSTTSGQIYLMFGISMDGKTFQGPSVAYNMVASGIEVYPKMINKVYFSYNNIVINFNSKVNTKASLLVTNLNGQIIDSRTISINQGEMQETLNLGILPKGIYILNMQTSYGTESKKFVAY